MKLGRDRLTVGTFRDIAQAVSSMPGVNRVETNLRSRSIVVYYDNEMHDDFHTKLENTGRETGLVSLKPPELSEVDALAENIQREAEFLAQHSAVARSVVDAAAALNNGLRRATNNNVDLKVLLPLALAVYAVIEHDPQLSTPLWVTLGIFSFNSFVALHPPKPLPVVTEMRKVADDSTGTVTAGP